MPRRCSSKKCPSGVFCIENTTILFVLIITAIFFFLYVMTQSVYKIALVNNTKNNNSHF